MAHLKSADVQEQMRKALRGEVAVRIKPGHDTWDATYAGNVILLFGDMEIMVFNDCDEFDYVDSAIAADGRVGNYDSWAKEKPPDDEDNSNNNPDRGWSAQEIAALLALFKAAT